VEFAGAGINWYPIANVRISANWIGNRFLDGLPDGPDRIRFENAVLFRFRIDY
jgi:hypothetical protein